MSCFMARMVDSDIFSLCLSLNPFMKSISVNDVLRSSCVVTIVSSLESLCLPFFTSCERRYLVALYERFLNAVLFL